MIILCYKGSPENAVIMHRLIVFSGRGSSHMNTGLRTVFLLAAMRFGQLEITYLFLMMNL